MSRRNTVQRELVLKTFLGMEGHNSADEIYARVAREYPTIGRGTVYRNLSVLAEEDKIWKIRVPGSADRYDRNIKRHCHIRCLKCGRVIDVETDGVPDLTERIRDAKGFTDISCDIVFTGLCENCSEAARREDDSNIR